MHYYTACAIISITLTCVKMAEMYRELVEFNDRLHKQMNKKDAIIVRLGQTLTMAKIEVSLDICSFAIPSHSSSYHMTNGLSPDASSN